MFLKKEEMYANELFMLKYLLYLITAEASNLILSRAYHCVVIMNTIFTYCQSVL